MTAATAPWHPRILNLPRRGTSLGEVAPRSIRPLSLRRARRLVDGPGRRPREDAGSRRPDRRLDAVLAFDLAEQLLHHELQIRFRDLQAPRDFPVGLTQGQQE